METRREALERKLAARKREALLLLVLFGAGALNLSILVIGTIALGEITSINAALGVVGVLFMCLIVRLFGSELKRSYRRLEKAQAKLDALDAPVVAPE